jgi:hypothetical protein
MKRNEPRTGPGKGPGRQAPHCTRRTFGQGRGGDCGYGRRSHRISSRPLASIMSSLVSGMLELADNSIRRLSTGIKKSHLLGDGSRTSKESLEDLRIRRQDLDLVQDANRKLPENHEESQRIADQQK